MELMDAILTRRSVRSFTSRPVAKEAIGELIRAATWAPSAVNQQPWAFVVIRNARRLDEYSERAKQYMLAKLPGMLSMHRRAEALADPGYHALHHAPVLVIIYAKPAQYDPARDCCMAAQNLLLAAHGLGLGTCPVGFVRPWLDLPEIKREMDVPESYFAVMPIAIGWPNGQPEAPPRQAPDVITWDEGPAVRSPAERS
jgi:nitroreductase